jgi:hypothetical protein
MTPFATALLETAAFLAVAAVTALAVVLYLP